VKNVITLSHLDSLAKMLLVTGWIVIVSYVVEFFMAWYSGDPAEIHQYFVTRPKGPGAPVFWAMIIGNVLAPQLLWSRRIRRNPLILWIVSIFVNVGMWSERFVIIVQSLEQEFTPSAWASYTPTWVDISLLIGSMSFFVLLFLLFLRYIPFIPASEVKELNHELARESGDSAHAGQPLLDRPLQMRKGAS
jgi:molybdopterin-containing oxidoreductase family membrane subunit